MCQGGPDSLCSGQLIVHTAFCSQTSAHFPAETLGGQRGVPEVAHSPDTAVPGPLLQPPWKPSMKEGAATLALRSELEGNRRTWQAGKSLGFAIWIIHLKLRKQLGDWKEGGKIMNKIRRSTNLSADVPSSSFSSSAPTDLGATLVSSNMFLGARRQSSSSGDPIQTHNLPVGTGRGSGQGKPA